MPTIDEMVLSEKDAKDVAYAKKQWKDDYGQRLEYRLKAKMYRETYLNKEYVSSGSLFRCYHEGVDNYTRKDGLPLTEEDIKAIHMASPGQGSEIVGDVGYLKVRHKWFVDSSD